MTPGFTGLEITLTWNAGVYTPRDATPYGVDYIFALELRDAANTLITMAAGLYIIEDHGVPIYGGQAQNLRARFDQRGGALRELGLRPTAALPDHAVRYATVNPADERALAERWLVRILYLRDQAPGPRALQNVELTGQLVAPPGGLTIRNQGARPAYLDEQYEYPGAGVI